MIANSKLTAVYEERPNGVYIAYVEEIPGMNTQGDTLEEAKVNLKEALEMILEVRRELTEKEIGSKKVIREKIELAASNVSTLSNILKSTIAFFIGKVSIIQYT